MQFTKMNGAGNSFIILDGIRGALDTARLPELARALCDPNFGVGADGLMAVLPADDADFTPIAQAIAKEHHGALRAESDEKTTRFTFTLPLVN